MSAQQDPSAGPAAGDPQKESRSRSKNAAPPDTPRAAPDRNRGRDATAGQPKDGDRNPRDAADRDSSYD